MCVKIKAWQGGTGSETKRRTESKNRNTALDSPPSTCYNKNVRHGKQLTRGNECQSWKLCAMSKAWKNSKCWKWQHSTALLRESAWMKDAATLVALNRTKTVDGAKSVIQLRSNPAWCWQGLFEIRIVCSVWNKRSHFLKILIAKWQIQTMRWRRCPAE